MVEEKDMNLFKVTDSVNEAVEETVGFYRFIRIRDPNRVRLIDSRSSQEGPPWFIIRPLDITISGTKGRSMNSISVIGTGYVGLVTGTCLAEFGLRVICMDVDGTKIQALSHGDVPIYEPGLARLVAKNLEAGRLRFTADVSEAVAESNMIFIAVGTPPGEDGSADMKHVLAAAESVAAHMTGYKIIVNKSTVPVGTGRRVKELVRGILDRRGLADLEFDVVSNPEFLREGSAVRDFMHPDRVVIGSETQKAGNLVRDIYNVLYLIETPFIFATLETAELIKYASNAYLATKITFINEIANLCDAVGADVHVIAKAMGLDGRIGKYFLHPGPGFGGSCLPKDTQGLARIGREHGVSMRVVEAVIEANEIQKRRMVEKIEAGLGDLRSKAITVLGLAFKPETDDMRAAPSIPIIHGLLSKGCHVRAYDPAAMENAARGAFASLVGTESLIYCRDEYEAAKGADAIVILTEWNQFRHLDLPRLRGLMSGRHFFDFRNVYEPKDMAELGFIYSGVGR
jgi:UDPglucose 6-dehydrogenase